MQIYSTKFVVREDFSKQKFVQLVIEWNQGSPYDKMNGVEWDGISYNLRYQDGKRTLAIDDLSEHNVIASRFRKEDENGVLWTTDFILNYQEKVVAIRLDRETTEATTSFVPKFSPPHFVKMLMKNGCAGMDGDLEISANALSITKRNSDIIKDIILKNKRYSLPIVYVTKTWMNNYPLNVTKLASELQGVAHVLKESDPAVSKMLMINCAGENVHHGGVGIYYPNMSVRDKKINNSDTSKYTPESLIHKITNIVYRYMNQQIRETMYTWEGIQNERLRLKNATLLKNHQKIENENNDLYDIFGAQLSEYEANIEGLNKKIDALTQENQGLHTKLDNMSEIPLLFFGEEEELYEGEIKDIILDVLAEYVKRNNNKKRRMDIIQDILNINDFNDIQAEKHLKIKKILKGYTNMPNTMRRELEEFGYTIASDGKHYKLTYYDDSRYVATMAKTSSDGRAGDNLASEIIKLML